ncbi:hypothetical protein Zmor_014572 [Zophobas morio]|uniref:Uncharacterized protein n=1 Tax=Zophobas morio TaxID=2755281 RepID=A0AA38IFB9_9CUCU|nr:hypothetical protein Zmor_014572 [Zophobas morio]
MKLDDDLCPHYLNLDFSENFLSDAELKIYVEDPYPIHKPLRYSKTDVICKYNEDIETYNDQLNSLSKDFPVVKNTIMNQSFTNSHATVTKGMLNFCNNVSREAAFPCDYNPYYASGVLEYLSLDTGFYLVRPDCRNNLRLINVENPWKNKKLQINQQFNEPITGLSSYDNSENVLLLLKHKKELNLLTLADVDDTDICYTKNFKINILDAKINKTKMCVVLSNSKVQLYDIETHQKCDLTVYDLNDVTRVEFIDENNIFSLEQKKLKMFDLRAPNYKLFKPDVNDCNYLCSVKSSDNVVYLSTRHLLMMTDLRFLKNVEFCTHLMKSSPCYMDIVDNILCLSSQKANEKVLFGGCPISSLPVTIPSILETLDKCRLQKDILLKPQVGERLRKSIGGLKLLSHNNDLFLYCVNSAGDIFKQQICKNPPSDDTDPGQNLYKWINCLPNDSQPLHLTNVANLSEARFSLNESLDETRFQKFTRKPKKVNYFLNNFKKKYHKDNLGELAANFLSIWEEDDEEERQQVNFVPEVAPRDKVSDWIESSYFFD